MLLPPQQYAAPAVVTPHMCELMLFCPDVLARDANVCPPLTGTGTSEPAVVPFPSCPAMPVPQQYACPVVVTAHGAGPSDVMLVSVRPPEMGVGLLASPADVPLPSIPNPGIPPQQNPASAVLTA